MLGMNLCFLNEFSSSFIVLVHICPFSILLKMGWGRQTYSLLSPAVSYIWVVCLCGLCKGEEVLLLFCMDIWKSLHPPLYLRMVSVTWDSSLKSLLTKWLGSDWHSVMTSSSCLWPKHGVWKPLLLPLNIVLDVCGILVTWLSPYLSLEKGRVKFFLVICVRSSSGVWSHPVLVSPQTALPVKFIILLYIVKPSAVCT